MNNRLKSFLIWLFAVVFTLATAVYQRKTGPTHPIKGEIKIDQQIIKYKLIRTYDGADGASIKILTHDTTIHGEMVYRRYKSHDRWVISNMGRSGDTLTGFLPHQAPAGKIMYQVTLIKGDRRYLLNNHPAVLRYKNPVPGYVLFPHILFIFMAMLFSTVTGLMALFKGKNVYLFAWITVITLTLGGMILGPIVQKFSFGAYWTGWPFGRDLTDNKSLIAFIFWLIALFILNKNRENRAWPVIASVILLVVFLIPHSFWGSEIDFTKQQNTEQLQK
ncbi:MAG: hypothetical protein M0P58_04990 [Bacteroidales bacterium]|nr:hypothetical protein [Bacteroidales bacterium]